MTTPHPSVQVSRRSRHGARRILRTLIALNALCLAGIACAQQAPRVQNPEQSLRMLIESDTSGLPGRVEIEVGALPEQIRLAPCERPEPFLPTGARLWGKAMVGMRCTSGASWSVLIPVLVRVYAPVLKAAQPLAVNRSLGTEDVRIEEVDLTREAHGALLDLAEVQGKVLARPIAAGAVLRRDQFKAPAVVTQGDQVRIVNAGPGFSISTWGRALQSGAAGQVVRVQVESGRVISGTAREDRLVEVRF